MRKLRGAGGDGEVIDQRAEGPGAGARKPRWLSRGGQTSRRLLPRRSHRGASPQGERLPAPSPCGPTASERSHAHGSPSCFQVVQICQETRARLGILTTPHGIIHTPAFLPVGTQGTVKALTVRDLETLGVEMVLANAYHLLLRPGVERIVQAGGVHRFIGWSHPILTDSGGFQVFSLSALRKVSDAGVEFQSHLDGSRHFLSPERITEVQMAFGADVIMCLDECVPFPCPEAYAEEALQRTIQWAARCRTVWETARRETPNPPTLFGIVQGAMSPRLRRLSAARTVALAFPGYAIGGLSVGEPKALREEILGVTVEELPRDRPRYLMGVGSPEDLWDGIAQGIDLFDCVLPTRNARNGQLFTFQGKLNIKNSKWQAVDEPVDPSCDCELCTRYTRAFLHHLFRAGELTALRLSTLHNVRFLLKLVQIIQQAIANGQYRAAHTSFLGRYIT